MQNIMRKQCSKGELPVGNKLELREMQGPLICGEGDVAPGYGSTNVAFDLDDVSPGTQARVMTLDMADKADFQPPGGGEGRESWDSKLQFMLATIG